MIDFVEAVLLLYPRDAGGRVHAVSPRDGSYRPWARVRGGPLLRIRVIEGPARLAPGEQGSVVVELETRRELTRGSELDLIELGEEPVGMITVLRVWTAAVAS